MEDTREDTSFDTSTQNLLDGSFDGPERDESESAILEGDELKKTREIFNGIPPKQKQSLKTRWRREYPD